MDESRPINLSTQRKNAEIVYDCKVRVEDELLAQKLANQFSIFKQKNGCSSRMRAGITLRPEPSCNFVTLMITLIPIINILYVVTSNLFLRRRYLIRIRKSIRRTEQFNKWFVE